MVTEPMSAPEPAVMSLLALGLVMLSLGRLSTALLARRLTFKTLREAFSGISRWLSMPIQFQALHRCTLRYKKALADWRT